MVQILALALKFWGEDQKIESLRCEILGFVLVFFILERDFTHA